MPNKILYLQYTNPAGYPPLEHSSRILAERGWQVLFIGTEAQGSKHLRFPYHQRIAVQQMPFQPAGWRQKLHYLRFCLWAFRWAVRWRPSWIYVSDALACPAALVLRRLPGLRFIYHEHDSPDNELPDNPFQRVVLRTRRHMAHHAAICILPNQQRLEHFLKVTGANPQHSLCVWNCPRLDEVAQPRATRTGDPLTLYYHGNIGLHSLPRTILEAMRAYPGRVQLHIVGYETIGTLGYLKQFQQLAATIGLADALHINSPQSRFALWSGMQGSDIGLGLVMGNDINLRMMVGASNKVFDYLAAGLPVLVPDTPDWKRTFVEPGYGRACNPNDAKSITGALHQWLEHPDEIRAMGEQGRQRILSDWNYERQFTPVLDYLCNY